MVTAPLPPALDTGMCPRVFAGVWPRSPVTCGPAFWRWVLAPRLSLSELQGRWSGDGCLGLSWNHPLGWFGGLIGLIPFSCDGYVGIVEKPPSAVSIPPANELSSALTPFCCTGPSCLSLGLVLGRAEPPEPSRTLPCPCRHSVMTRQGDNFSGDDWVINLSNPSGDHPDPQPLSLPTNSAQAKHDVLNIPGMMLISCPSSFLLCKWKYYYLMKTVCPFSEAYEPLAHFLTPNSLLPGSLPGMLRSQIIVLI